MKLLQPLMEQLVALVVGVAGILVLVVLVQADKDTLALLALAGLMLEVLVVAQEQ